MTHSPPPLADAFASLRTALEAAAMAAPARPSGTLEALLLAFLVRLLRQLEALARDNAARPRPRCPAGPATAHAAAAADIPARHRFPDWVVPCAPGLGMRPAATPRATRPHPTGPVRAPPGIAARA